VKGAEALAEALAANTTLARLCLNDNYLGAGGAKAIAAALTTNTAIREIQLRGNELGDEGLAAIAEALMVRLTVVVVLLSLARGACVAHTDFGVAACWWLCSSAPHTPVPTDPPNHYPTHTPKARDAPIEVLDVGNNSLSPESADVLTRLLYQKTAIKDVNLYMNELGNNGIAQLAPAIAACK